MNVSDFRNYPTGYCNSRHPVKRVRMSWPLPSLCSKYLTCFSPWRRIDGYYHERPESHEGGYLIHVWRHPNYHMRTWNILDRWINIPINDKACITRIRWYTFKNPFLVKCYNTYLFKNVWFGADIISFPNIVTNVALVQSLQGF